MADPDNVIGIAVVDPQDGYAPIMRVGPDVLKQLLKMMAPYGADEYELGTIVRPDGDKVLVLKIVDGVPGRIDSGFVLAGRTTPILEERAKKAINDPSQSQIAEVEV